LPDQSGAETPENAEIAAIFRELGIIGSAGFLASGQLGQLIRKVLTRGMLRRAVWWL